MYPLLISPRIDKLSKSSAIMKVLKGFLSLFWKLHRPVVRKNLQLKGLHKGETCLIFGNGGSLKYFDLSVLPNHPAICTANSLVDKRLTNVNVRYWVVPDSYALYPLRFIPSFGRFVWNTTLTIKKKIISENKHVRLICSLTNFYSFFTKGKKAIYFHHFGDRGSSNYDLAGSFSTCAGSLDIMLGLARYMGFSKVILFGCDYLGSPKLEGHFYSDSVPHYGKDDPQYVERIKKAVGDLEVLVILPKGSTCAVFESSSFEDCFGVPEKYHSNTEIVAEEYLTMMRNAASKKQIWM
jgi:hypothetical protein